MRLSMDADGCQARDVLHKEAAEGAQRTGHKAEGKEQTAARVATIFCDRERLCVCVYPEPPSKVVCCLFFTSFFCFNRICICCVN